jgi:hypothetical protein
MKKLSEIIKNISKVTKKKNITLVVANDNKYIVKKNENKMIYDYLSSRGFTYYLEPIKRNDDYNIFDYIDEVETPKEQKALDIIYLMAYLHKKTTYYKEINLDDIKKIYEDTINQINYLNEYYHNLQDSLEQEEFFSPSTYMLLTRISIIYNCLNYCMNTINKWYEDISKKSQIRYALIHNNLKTSHLLEADNKYIISWEKSKKDIPIYDFYHFFLNEYENVDFTSLYETYIDNYPLEKEEQDLLFVFLSIPDKIDLDLDEYNNCLKINKLYSKLYRVNQIILNNRTKQEKPKQPQL